MLQWNRYTDRGKAISTMGMSEFSPKINSNDFLSVNTFPPNSEVYVSIRTVLNLQISSGAFGLDWSHLNLKLELRAKQASTTYIGNRRYYSHIGPPVAKFAEFSKAWLGHTYQLMMPYCSCSLSQTVVFSRYYHLRLNSTQLLRP